MHPSSTAALAVTVVVAVVAGVALLQALVGLPGDILVCEMATVCMRGSGY